MSNEWMSVLEQRFPLLNDLRFHRTNNDFPEQLPSVVGLLTAICDHRAAGDVCVVVPCRENIATFVAVLAALSAAREQFPLLLEQYLADGFKKGDRVRVLPGEHIFEFDGFFEDEYGQFFRLCVPNKPDRGTRSFPIREAVRLEKTTKKRPLGTGGVNLGNYVPHPLDCVVDIATGGNKALLNNEIMLVTTQKEFLEFMDNTWISNKARPADAFPLREVIPWGVVNSEGDIEFRDSAAATGKPLIAVSARTEYIAEACRRNQAISPRVVIDGAVRIRDLQSFDEILDYSKLLVVADHTRLHELDELANRDCAVWKLPGKIEDIYNDRRMLLDGFSRRYRNASEFQLEVIECESEEIDLIAASLDKAASLMDEQRVDPERRKILAIGYARLMELAACVGVSCQNISNDFVRSTEAGIALLERESMYIDQQIVSSLKTGFSSLKFLALNETTDFDKHKKRRLLTAIEQYRNSSQRVAVVATTRFSLPAIRTVIESTGIQGIAAIAPDDVTEESEFDQVIVTGWPRARHLRKFLNMYAAPSVLLLVYPFEQTLFARFFSTRERDLQRWTGSEDRLQSFTGEHFTLPDQSTWKNPFESVSRIVTPASVDPEELLKSVRKGIPPEERGEPSMISARYFGFTGAGYAYLTEHYELPTVTEFMTGSSTSEKQVPLSSVKKLQLGDFVVFRSDANRQKDLISEIAAESIGNTRYKTTCEEAASWKSALGRLGSESDEVWSRLKRSGLNRALQTVKNWMYNPSLIGPMEQSDLISILTAAEDRELLARSETIWRAISDVRSAHREAGRELSGLLMTALPDYLPDAEDGETTIELSLRGKALGSVHVVQVDVIATETESRSEAEVNRVLWDY